MIYGSVCSGIEAASVAWHPLGWRASFLSGSKRSLARSWPTITRTPLSMATSRRSQQDNTTLSIFSLVEPPASPSASPAYEADWTTTVATWPSNILGLLTDSGPDGWFGRTSPASCRRTADGTLEPFSGAWSNSGMGSPTEFLTLNTLEWPSDAVVCSLSDTLETGDVPQRFYLSATACRGILRRAEKRGNTLPPPLARALQAAAGLEPTSISTAA